MYVLFIFQVSTTHLVTMVTILVVFMHYGSTFIVWYGFIMICWVEIKMITPF